MPPPNIWTPMLTNIPSLCNKSLRVRIKVAHGKLFLGVARLVWRCAVTATYENRERRIQKRVSVLWKKKRKTKEQFYNDFRKVVVYNSKPDSLLNLRASENKRPRNRTYDGCLQKLGQGMKVRTSKIL